MASIHMRGVTKLFGDLTAVKELTLDIDDKEFVAFLGPSGCGKTTTLNMLAGLETVTEGEIYFDDRLVNDVPPQDRQIGFVFQNYAIFGHMTVFQNVAIGLTLRGESKEVIDQEVEAVLRLLRLEEVKHARASRLSVNLMQKVAIGRSMITKPKIFFLDEPFSNLDAAFRLQMRAELKRLQRELGQTMIYVTHDQVEAMTMADRIAVMNFAVLQQYDTPEVIYNHPLNTFVAGFIGSPNMNLLGGEVERADGGLRFRLADDPGKVTVELSGPLRERLSRYPEKRRLTLGIRPENVEVCTGLVAGGLEARVVHSELLGSKTILHTRVGAAAVQAVTPADFSSHLGETRWLRLDQGRVHFFDGDTGKVLR